MIIETILLAIFQLTSVTRDQLKEASRSGGKIKTALDDAVRRFHGLKARDKLPRSFTVERNAKGLILGVKSASKFTLDDQAFYAQYEGSCRSKNEELGLVTLKIIELQSQLEALLIARKGVDAAKDVTTAINLLRAEGFKITIKRDGALSLRAPEWSSRLSKKMKSRNIDGVIDVALNNKNELTVKTKFTAREGAA